MTAHENDCWTAVAIISHELCNDVEKPNITYRFEPYSWWFCCHKMEKEMGKSIEWNDKKAFVYIYEVTGCDGEGVEHKIDNCPFCGKPVVIEQSKRLQHHKKIVNERYK